MLYNILKHNCFIIELSIFISSTDDDHEHSEIENKFGQRDSIK